MESAKSEKKTLVTIGILSWNRLHYLRATVESAKYCLEYPDLQWIISDNESVEPGVKSYIHGLSWPDVKIFKQQSHAEAMNQIIDIAEGEYVMLLPDDAQFVVRGAWLAQMIDLLERHPNVGGIALDFQSQLRLKTYSPSLNSFFRYKYRYGLTWKGAAEISSSAGYKALLLPSHIPGIAPAGILSLTRRSVWQQLGRWKVFPSRQSIVDSSLGAEDDMSARFADSGLELRRAIPFVPVAASILTDPTGTNAKVRNGYRYGLYKAPNATDFYYQIWNLTELLKVGLRKPLAFEEYVKPLDGALPLDMQGNLLKSSINTSIAEKI